MFSANENEMQEMENVVFDVNKLGEAADGSMQEVIPKLWIGNLQAAGNSDLLYKHGITHVLSVGVRAQEVEGVKYTVFNGVRDRPDYRILAHFNEATNYLKNTLGENTQNGVLVHCQMGQSRSAIIVMAYLMRYKGFRFAEAWTWSHSRRPNVWPNVGFKIQLRVYEICKFEDREQYNQLNIQFLVCCHFGNQIKELERCQEKKEPMNMERAIEFQCDLEDLCDYKYWTFSRNLKARIRSIICQVKNRQLPYYNNARQVPQVTFLDHVNEL